MNSPKFRFASLSVVKHAYMNVGDGGASPFRACGRR